MMTLTKRDEDTLTAALIARHEAFLRARAAGQPSPGPTRFRADAWALITRCAEKKHADDPTLTMAQAVDQVMRERPGLYDVYLTGMRLRELGA